MRINWDQLKLAASRAIHFEGRPFTGIAFELYPGGVLCSETTIVDGVEQGEVRCWFEHGTLQRREAKWGGALHGKSVQWTSDGHLRREEWYAFGVKLVELSWPSPGDDAVLWRLSEDDHLRDTLSAFRRKFVTAPVVLPGHGDVRSY